MSSFAANVVPFRSAKRPGAARRDQKGLMEAVYTAGSLPISAEDCDAKLMAARLQIFGFVVIDQIEADGTARRLRPSEAMRAELSRPWRVSKPSFSGYSAPESDEALFEPRPVA